jgi:hypothetical protein
MGSRRARAHHEAPSPHWAQSYGCAFFVLGFRSGIRPRRSDDFSGPFRRFWLLLDMLRRLGSMAGAGFNAMELPVYGARTDSNIPKEEAQRAKQHTLEDREEKG